MQAAIAGLTKNTSPHMIYRAGLESIALRLGAIVSLMASTSKPIHEQVDVIFSLL